MSSAEFRLRVADWFRTATPADWETRFDQASPAEYLTLQREWLAALNEQGFAAPHVPTEWGGGGYDLFEQAVIYEEWARAKAPGLGVFLVSLHHVPSTLIEEGTVAQREQHIRAAINGAIWCQGFSEPEAGSDLASLRTTAELDGDEYVVNGQKIWSSSADHAKWCLLLARTDPHAPKHKGISYFILDMESPGIEVRPIRQSSGHSEFCEIFLTDVRVPVGALIGGPGDGWAIAQRTLATERGPIALETIERINGQLVDLYQLVQRRSSFAGGTNQWLSAAEAELARLIARGRAVRSLALDMIEALAAGKNRLDLASIIKVSFSELLRETTDFASLLAEETSLIDPRHAHTRGWVSGHGMTDFIQSWGWTIASGTNEIQRNIIAERLLSMPKEPKVA